MAIFKCKMCGGALEVTEDQVLATCEYCGTQQTLPKIDDEKKLALFNRANNLRIKSEFDKAAGIYESIIAEFPEEAEAYWCLMLCKYGIEYVDDPATDKKIPTCHRSSFDSLMDDSDFEMVMENADPVSRRVYREEAKAIEELRKSIVQVSSAEEPYDIFICYKETDDTGDRTIDSEIAQDVYTVLTEKGYRVFFSRITLEDRLGQEYEPYIFAALNSAKVMLAFGTDYEYYNAVWVKNEWSRFLKLIAKGEKKTLIPCYKNIDAYDIPKEFAKLQAQDMGKVGAIQDLVRGIEKLLPKNEPVTQVKETVVVNNGASVTVDSLLKRAFMFLEDGDWKSANEYCEKVLDINPECAEAYLGKLMVDLHIRDNTAFSSCTVNFETNKNYKKIVSFGNEELKNELAGYIELVNNHLELIKKQKLEEVYQGIILNMDKAETSSEFMEVASAFEDLGDYKNSKELCQKCKNKVDEIEKKLYEKKAKARKLCQWISCYDCTICLKSDGTVVSTTFNAEKRFDYGQCNVDGWEDIIAVSASAFHTVGLKSDGTVVATRNKRKHHDRQCDVDGWADIIAVSAGVFHTVGLKSDGTVVAVGDNNHAEHCFGKCDVDSWTDIIAVSAGDSHTVGLKSDGTVVAVGGNAYGQCNVRGWKDIVAISAGGTHTVGLKSDGTVVAVGKNDDKRCDVSYWRDIVAVSAGIAHTVGLKADGTVVAVGLAHQGRCKVYGWKDVVAVSAGRTYTLGLKSDGTVISVGESAYGGCNIANFKLFDDYDNFELEQKDKFEKRRLAKEKRLSVDKEIAEQKAQYRSRGLCQYCGGTLKKGLFGKKCSYCGKPKDY